MADSEHQFLGYLRMLFEAGIWIDSRERMIHQARALMDPSYEGAEAPTWLSPEWTIERRRLLVALTWPHPLGIPAILEVPPAALDRPEGEFKAVRGRLYADLWSDVRDNLKALTSIAQRSGYPDETGDVLRDAARLGVLRGHRDVALDPSVADALIADPIYRTWRDGHLLYCWDIVDAAEGLCVRFEETQQHPDGILRIDLEVLVAKLRRARLEAVFVARVPGLIREAHEELTRQIENQDGGPLALHLRITAGGLIQPPAPGSKYRHLFDRIDGFGGRGRQPLTLTRDEIDALIRQGATSGPRLVRGSRGDPGTPAGALKDKTWWYGPWNADLPDRRLLAGEQPSEDVAARIKQLLGKKPWTRAWLASGMRAFPTFVARTLESVTFMPVKDRPDWWHWRQGLRDGTFEPVASS